MHTQTHLDIDRWQKCCHKRIPVVPIGWWFVERNISRIGTTKARMTGTTKAKEMIKKV